MTSAEAPEFPKVQGGGSLILAWQIKGKHVLVVGGGEVAAGRILNCLDADAFVTVICPASGLNPEVRHRVAQGQVTHIDANFAESDLDATYHAPPSCHQSTAAACSGLPSMVLVAVDDPAASTAAWQACRARRIPANIADVPPECDFYFGSMHRAGPVQVMVSTNGRGPRLAAAIRRRVAASIPPVAGDAVDAVGRLRAALRAVAPAPKDGPRRMRWVSAVSDKYSWHELAAMEDADVENLLARFWPEGTVPEMDELKAMRGNPDAEIDVWDGSFGFSVGC